MTFPTSILRKSISLVLALGAGFLGSELHSRLHQGRPYGTIRSARFELLDESGKTIAFWQQIPCYATAGIPERSWSLLIREGSGASNSG